jgi:hypothetical protein
MDDIQRFLCAENGQVANLDAIDLQGSLASGIVFQGAETDIEN